jgi:hypothetical protein
VTPEPAASAARRLAVARSWLGVAVGTALLVEPERVARRVCRVGHRPPSPVIRLLGARELGQSAAVLLRSGRPVAATGMVLDLLHGMSMVAAAMLLPAYRRAAVVSGSEAFLGAVMLTPITLAGSR